MNPRRWLKKAILHFALMAYLSHFLAAVLIYSIYNDIDFKLLKNTFRKRNINVLFCETFDESKEIVLDRIPHKSTIGIGHSQTLQNMRITETLIERGNTVFDKELGKDKAETTKLKKKALLADYYITGSNAVSEDGRIVNIDHSGNRVAALAFGPDKVACFKIGCIW